MTTLRPDLGHGIGLRPAHYQAFLEAPRAAGFVEVISENFLGRGGRPLSVLEAVRREVPVLLHGVSLSIGALDDLDPDYLRRLRALVDRVEPAVVSDHLCWGRHGGRYVHDLWPLPYTEEALARVVERVGRVQEALGRRLLLENVSSYVEFAASTLSEWEFLGAVAERADCGILLDVNNIYVSAVNHDFAAETYLAGVPPGRVGQIHLAGHSDRGSYLHDTHDAPVAPAVWELYAHAVRRFGHVPTLIEWDDNLPDLSTLLAESARAAAVEAGAMAGGARAAG